MDELLRGKRAIVTGASRGIGNAVAIALLRAGVSVALLSRQATAAAQVLETEAIAHGTKVVGIPTDLLAFDRIEAQVAAAIAALEGTDILINNAGAVLVADVANTSLSDWQRLLDLNLTSAFLCARAVLPTLRSQGSGTILNVASIAAKQGFPGWGAYSASKFGLLGLTQSLAAEERARGIRVMAICPGAVSTALWDDLPPETAAQFDRTLMLTPEIVAQAILSLLALPPEAVVTEFTLMSRAGVL